MSDKHDETVWYLDSSVALYILLGLSEGAIEWYERTLDAGQDVVSSRLISLEVARVLRRESIPVDLGDAFTSELVLLCVDDALMEEAAAIETHVKSLDALHLASALRLGTAVTTIVTHDKSMAKAATHVGFTVFDPLVDAFSGGTR